MKARGAIVSCLVICAVSGCRLAGKQGDLLLRIEQEADSLTILPYQDMGIRNGYQISQSIDQLVVRCSRDTNISRKITDAYLEGTPRLIERSNELVMILLDILMRAEEFSGSSTITVRAALWDRWATLMTSDPHDINRCVYYAKCSQIRAFHEGDIRRNVKAMRGE
jgi:hypothetical protein